MACCAVDNNEAMNCKRQHFDYELALSLDKFPAEGCLSSHSRCGGSAAASSDSCAASSASCSALPFSSLKLHLKLSGKDEHWDDKTSVGDEDEVGNDLADYDLAEDEQDENDIVDYDLDELAEDEQQEWQVASKESAVSDLSEPLPQESKNSENEPAKGRPSRPAWADLVDSEDETASIQATCSESEDEEETASPSPAPAADVAEVSNRRTARPSRAARRRSARTEADEEEVRSGSATGQGVGAEFATPKDHVAPPQRDSNKGAGKSNVTSTENKTNKVAERDNGKGSSKGGSKGADKGTGKGKDKITSWDTSHKTNNWDNSNKATSWDTSHKGEKGYGKAAYKGASKGGKDSGKGASKNSGKGKGKSKGKGKGKGKTDSEKYQCQIIVGIEEDAKFRVVRRLIGSGGENMKSIHECSGARLRLRGRGSKFLEGDGDEKAESTDDLMLCISADDDFGYEAAKAKAVELIEGIHNSYRAFCRARGKDCSELELVIHEGYRPGSR